MLNKPDRIWGARRSLIGMVHLRALPGSPRSSESVPEIARVAAEEARVLVDTGFDGIIVENMHDAPYVHSGVDGRGHAPETVAAMTRCAMAVRQVVPERVPIGVQVLSGGNREALAIALACGLRFIRCENFVFSHVADEGLLARAEAGPLLRARRAMGADHVAVFCDLKKKHASHTITSDVSLAEMAHAAEFFGADGLIVTGVATGRATDPRDVEEVRGATRLPLLVGAGVTPENATELFDAGADGLIAGSSIKRGGVWSNPIDAKRCRALAKACKR